jgi:hypothetical protein
MSKYIRSDTGFIRVQCRMSKYIRSNTGFIRGRYQMSKLIRSIGRVGLWSAKASVRLNASGIGCGLTKARHRNGVDLCEMACSWRSNERIVSYGATGLLSSRVVWQLINPIPPPSIRRPSIEIGRRERNKSGVVCLSVEAVNKQ